MTVKLRPEMERFIEDQLNAGHFKSRAEVLEAGLTRLMLDPAEEHLNGRWSDEIERRAAAYDRGETTSSDAAEAIERVRGSLRAGKLS